MPPVDLGTLVVVTVVVVVGVDAGVRLGTPVRASPEPTVDGLARTGDGAAIAGGEIAGGFTAGDGSGAAAGVTTLRCAATATTRA